MGLVMIKRAKLDECSDLPMHVIPTMCPMVAYDLTPTPK
jgi:hypothetical protein